MRSKLLILLFGLMLVFPSCATAPKDVSGSEIIEFDLEAAGPSSETVEETQEFDLSQVPSYTGSPYTIINGNIPFIDGKTEKVFEYYEELDEEGRCGVAFANICQELMPSEERESISEVKPSGWNSIKADDVDGGWLYNRCHLIGFQLAGENANEKNLITGTRYLNTEGMLPFENMIADYVKETNHHVLYRVTPCFQEGELVARGVLMEAQSVEDDEIQFNVFCYNVQPGWLIDYADGSAMQEVSSAVEPQNNNFVLNKKTKKYHLPTCKSVTDISDKNKEVSSKSAEEFQKEGYSPCKICCP